MPFSGIIIPNNKVLGLSKFGRLVDCFSKRLQIQERLVHNIADSIIKNLNTEHLFVVCKVTHSCMSCRGVKKQQSKTVNIFSYGKFKNYNELYIIKLVD